MTFRTYLLGFLWLLLPGISPTIAAEKSNKMEQVLERLVNEQKESNGLVGLGAVLLIDGQTVGPAVNGERKLDSQVPLQSQDLWHIGSVTKPFTATMIARLIEKGKLDWSTSIEDIFFDVYGLNSQWRDVTLEQLLTHTSGAAPNFPILVRLKYPEEGVDRMIARESAVIKVMRKAPKFLPGSTFGYSNVGYTIAGVMAEKTTGLPWEELIRQEVFAPLKIQSGGFGPPKNIDNKLTQPRGHKKWLGFTKAAGTQDDNTPIMGPAGAIHLSLTDLAQFANEHLKGAQGRGILLKQETYQRLHTPVLDDYAFGWVVNSPKAFDAETVLWHNGSNTMWYALLAILPNYNAVVAVTANDGNFETAEKSASEIIKQLSQTLATSKTTPSQ